MGEHDTLFGVGGKVVVITGGCGLIGRALARGLSERDAQVVVADVESADPEHLFGRLGVSGTGFRCDVSRSSDVSQLLAGSLRQFGRVDVLINCHTYKAMESQRAVAEAYPEDTWDRMMEVNLKGTFLTCREFGRQMLDQGRGSIINMASTYGIVSSNPALYEENSVGNPVAYSASKGGVVMLTKYLGAHWAARGVRVNAITPHGVWNNHEEAFIRRFDAMSPMKRLSQPQEVLGAVVFLASDASSYVTGSNVLVEGGWCAW